MSKMRSFFYFLFVFMGMALALNLKAFDVVEEISFESKKIKFPKSSSSYDMEDDSLIGFHVTRVFSKDGSRYFVKKVDSRTAISALIARKIVEKISDFEKRFPEIIIGLDKSKSDVEFYLISKELSDFESCHNIGLNHEQNPFYFEKEEDKKSKLKDFSHLYVSLFLIGGGDTHDRNVFYSVKSGVFGFIDFDLAFMKHFNMKRIVEKCAPGMVQEWRVKVPYGLS